MAFSTNRVVLVGRLTRSAELRALPAGTSVCGLRIACNSSRRNPDGTYSERPNYFDVSIYGPAAENVAKFTDKGSRVAVDGRLEWREWEHEGTRRQAVSIVADSVQFLDSPGSREDGADPDDDLSASLEEGELAGVGVGSDLGF